MRFRYFLLCIIFIVFAPFVFGQTSTIKINEFLIDPTPQSVELLNTGTEIVDLSNWYIDDNGGTSYFTIPQGTNLYPNACLSFSGNFNLNRTTADTVRLFDSTAAPTTLSANLIDSFDYTSSSGSGITFQRIPDGQSIWATGSANFNSYNLTGQSCIYVPPPTATVLPTATTMPTENPTPTNIPLPSFTSTPISTETPSITNAPSPTPTQTISPTPTIGAIYLSEIYPYPNENEKEWIELYNDNVFSVQLQDWKIDDIADGGSSPKKINVTIPGYSFKAIDLTTSVFNNDGDDVRLLNSNDALIDSFVYDSSEKGKSIGRVSFRSSNYCTQNPSKENSNNSCLLDSVITPTPTPSVTPTPSITISPMKSAAAVLGEHFSSNKTDYGLVRPSQFYTRPTSGLARSIDEDKGIQKEKVRTDPRIRTVRTATIITSIISFLTAGFLFIRIIL